MLTKKDSKKKELVVLSVIINQLRDSVSLKDALKMVEFWKQNNMISDTIYSDLINGIKKDD